MEQILNLSAEQVRELDPEAFARVWARVVPAQEYSPIALKEAPRGAQDTKTQRPPPTSDAAPDVSGEREQLPPPPAKTGGVSSQEQQLAQLLQLLAKAKSVPLTGGQSRLGKTNAALHIEMAQERSRARRQLAAAYFLETGRMFQGERAAMATRSGTSAQWLREQFLWEQRWEGACIHASAQLKDPALQELCRQLGQDARLRGSAIRRALALLL